ncbi:hypothetical protein O181_011445 [Austropuccinia psidii MF-1]|uniref:Uncharacterized protein n=1 Tax=Austropuccinia psidii MF-1 TaxID=1389203 RepID=A0A9Q3GLX3_9BASI|nr:hypothetical protein [Austropuccinia psidii MF-1]
MGGRPGRSIYDAFAILTSWIKAQWRKQRIFMDTTYEVTLKRLLDKGKSSLDWGLRHGAIFDWKKAKVITFSHKKIVTPEPFLFGDQELKFEKEVKWLGLILDQKLTFKNQIAKTKAIFTSSYNQLARIIKITYGINNQEDKQLVSAVIQSRVLYGSLVWFTKRNEKSVSAFLETAHNKCVRLTTGFLKQTPIVFLKHDGVLKSLLNAHTRLAHNYIYRVWILPPSHPVKNIVKNEIADTKQTHLSPISLVIRKEMLRNLVNTNAIKLIYPRPMAPWLPILTPPLNLSLMQEDAKR